MPYHTIPYHTIPRTIPIGRSMVPWRAARIFKILCYACRTWRQVAGIWIWEDGFTIGTHAAVLLGSGHRSMWPERCPVQITCCRWKAQTIVLAPQPVFWFLCVGRNYIKTWYRTKLHMINFLKTNILSCFR
jgi:hypothetical protein